MRERVADQVYVTTSELYAQVNAGIVVGPDWSVLIDTLAYPQETRELKDFVEKDLGSRVRYLIQTHYHADHTLGASFFPEAVVIAHEQCRMLLDSRGRKALEEAKRENPDLRELEIVLPDIVIDDDGLSVRVGRKTLELTPLPGHSPDGIGVLIVEDRVLFSGDVMMPLPYVVDGDIPTMIESLRRIPRMKLENLVQGHGEVILRGEISEAVRSNSTYLGAIDRYARRLKRRKTPVSGPDPDVEEFGKSRILMNGLGGDLHQRNLDALLGRSRGQGIL